MADGIAGAVKNAAVATDADALRQLVAAHGGAAARADTDLTKLTELTDQPPLSALLLW